jgi:hypothetical protein
MATLSIGRSAASYEYRERDATQWVLCLCIVETIGLVCLYSLVTVKPSPLKDTPSQSLGKKEEWEIKV